MGPTPARPTPHPHPRPRPPHPRIPRPSPRRTPRTTLSEKERKKEERKARKRKKAKRERKKEKKEKHRPDRRRHRHQLHPRLRLRLARDLRSTDSAQLPRRTRLPPSATPLQAVGPPPSLARCASCMQNGSYPAPALAIELHQGDSPRLGAPPRRRPAPHHPSAPSHRHLSLRTEPGLRLHRTPTSRLSLGIPAIAIGAVVAWAAASTTPQEWYDPTGRTLALRRILLTLLDSAALAAERSV